MKIITNILLIIFFAGVIFLTSCKKPETYPIVPHIDFSSFTKLQNAEGVDEKGILELSFTDGDGDIGLSPDDSLPPFNKGSIYYYDFFIKYYRKQKGVFVADTSVHNNSRLPLVTPNGSNKAIKGTIDIDLFINNPIPPANKYDTICYDVYIVDRALNQSNTIRTPDIIVKEY